jgi:membrane-bound metal-dependent hydrolase YbcI (DUF457 family)
VASPVGHGLAAVAAGWLVAKPPATRKAVLIQTAMLAAIGVMPDLDLLIGRHSAETHSIGVAAIVASVAALGRVPVATNRWCIWLAIFLAWMTHPLLDAFTEDSSVPIGIMVWWPFSSAYVHSGVTIFDSIYRRWWLPGFFEHNFHAALKELVLIGPIFVVVVGIRRNRTRRSLALSSARDDRRPPGV